MSRQCVICEIDISQRHPRAKVCSDACSHARKIDYMRRYNAQLLTTDGDRVRADARSRYKRRPRKAARCTICDAALDGAVHPLATVCSTDCREVLTRQNRKEWKAANPDKVAANAKRYQQRNPAKVREKNRRYERNHRERLNEKRRKWKAENREHLRQYQNDRRAADPAKYQEYARQRYARNADEIREMRRMERARDPERFRAAARRRNAERQAAVEVLRDMELI